MTVNLFKKYEEKVRPCIDLINSLHVLGVEQDLTLPAIAVIGDRSSGKSSVLEALSGVSLPRGKGVVTRCPLKLKMKKSRKDGFWRGKITFKHYERDIDDPADVEKAIRDAHNMIPGTGLGISDELISLEVTSANVSDLTLIDLPGITRAADGSQPENTGENIKRLIRKFIKKQDTFILVVVPCDVDIFSTEALKIAQEVDPTGKRTFGILTKPDQVDKGKEETVVSIINNDIIYLNKGYTIIKCRAQGRVSLHEPIQNEKDFFQKHPHFKTLYDKGKATIPNLAEKLTFELVLHIKQSLPQLEEKILMKLAETQAELDLYGRGPPTEPGQRSDFLINKITHFTQDIINLTAGEEVKSILHMNVFPGLRKEFAQWKNDLEIESEKFNTSLENELREYEEKHRGREFPSFLKYTTFEVIVKNQIKQLEEPAVRRLRNISDLIREAFIKLAQSNFPGFPNLLKMAKTKIENIKQVKELEAESMLKTQFKMELMIYTQDSVYMVNLQNAKKMEEDEERRTHGVARSPSHNLYDHSDNEAALEELRRHIKAYNSIVTNRLADQVPLVIRYMVLQESAAQLQREMIKLMQDKVNINELLIEEHDITSKRNNLQSRQKRLTEALKFKGLKPIINSI